MELARYGGTFAGDPDRLVGRNDECGFLLIFCCRGCADPRSGPHDGFPVERAPEEWGELAYCVACRAKRELQLPLTGAREEE